MAINLLAINGLLNVLTTGHQLLLPVDLRQQLVHHVQLLKAGVVIKVT